MTRTRWMLVAAAALVAAAVGVALLVSVGRDLVAGTAPLPVVPQLPITGRGATAEVAGVAVSPLRASVPEGSERWSTTFHVTNTGTTTVRLAPAVVELSPTGSRLPDSVASAARWAEVQPESARLEPGQTSDFVVTVQAPSAREPGERRIGVIYQHEGVAADGVGLVPAVGVSLFVPGAGTVVRRVSLGELSLPTVAWGGDVPLTVPVVNAGNVHQDFQTTGNEVAASASAGGEFGFDQGVALPGETATLRGVWQAPPLCWCEIAVGLASDDGDGMVVARGQVLVVRAWVVLLLAGVVLGIAVVLVAVRRRRSRRGRTIVGSPPGAVVGRAS